MLAIFTALHFLVDGVCAAAMAAYAVKEPSLAPIVYYFGLYNGIAFGTQWLMGLLLDKKTNWIRYAFLFVLVTLGAGTQSVLGIKVQTILLGIGNSVFHVAAGSLVLRSYTTYKELGIFVSSGAVGLALGLNCIVGPYPFLLACAVLCVAVTKRIWTMDIPEAAAQPAKTEAKTHNERNRSWAKAGHGEDVNPEPAKGALQKSANPLPWAAGISLVLLLGCIVLRGFGGGGLSGPYVMLFPCVFAAGKALGGIICDRAGYRQTVLFIFLLSFAALQIKGLLSSVLLVLAFNMTMPLTLRLVHWCNSRYPGMMFGLAAGCLLPGVFLKGFSMPPQAMAVLQFLCLVAAGWLLREKTA